jgi:hypothetical protein
MERSKIFALALVVTGVFPAAAFAACTADSLAGNWKCGGGEGACVRGHDISQVFQANDGSWRLKDGMGYEAQLSVDGNNVTAHYLDGPRADASAFAGTIDDTCHKIAWSATHQDVKY